MHSSTIFSSKLCDIFCFIASKDILGFDIQNIPFLDSILDNISPKLNISLNLDEFEAIAIFFLES